MKKIELTIDGFKYEADENNDRWKIKFTGMANPTGVAGQNFQIVAQLELNDRFLREKVLLIIYAFHEGIKATRKEINK